LNFSLLQLAVLCAKMFSTSLTIITGPFFRRSNFSLLQLVLCVKILVTFVTIVFLAIQEQHADLHEKQHVFSSLSLSHMYMQKHS